MTSLLLDIKSDYWSIDGKNEMYNFSFDFIPEGYFRDTIKEITSKLLNMETKSVSTLHRYNYSLKAFFEFLKEEEIDIKTFEEIEYEMIELFVLYLLENKSSASTRSIVIAALKSILDHGTFFQMLGFPKHTIFDGTEFRMLKTQDTLKTKVIEDDHLAVIDKSLEVPFEIKEKEDGKRNIKGYLIHPMVAIIRHTGIRISEALLLTKDCIEVDILGKNLLEVVSPKNLTERYIPVNNKVKSAVQYLVKKLDELGLNNPKDKLFSYRGQNGDIRVINPKDSREKLEIWLARNHLPRTITFHSFRHTLGTEMLNNGLSPFEIQQYLGHQSMHSTRLYAKVRNDKLTEEYKKLGFIGTVKESLEDIKTDSGEEITQETKLVVQLPDGACGKPLAKEVPNCKKPNACLFCPKFITTPEFLDVHEDHLRRIRADKARYMAEDLFGNEHVLNQTEKALETIIDRLKALQGGENIG
ncbi:tyrosine-type recombinase/integrase [Solibacillus sp. FSL R7-0668]|uniref:tyrosine-type recombinase/integrase n=1 Tax=Solibacillus sp. FSL R7-0668 TaxID=2921688 RepID=UPI0030FB6021